jgi:RNA polymerase-binding transcription factor
MPNKKPKKPKTKKAVKTKPKKAVKKSIKTPAKKHKQKTKIIKKKREKQVKRTLQTSAKKTLKKPKIKPLQKKKPIKKITISKKPKSEKFKEARKATLRKLLINRREEIIKEAKEEISKYIKGETRQLVDTALDDGDWSIIDLSEDISLRQLSTHRQTLLKIDEALRKLDEGTYGMCEDCGEEISEERLEILSFAIYCIDCQEKREELEKIKRQPIIG